MTNPLRSSTVATAAVGDGLGVLDREQKQSYVLNATSALVFQHCDGQTTPRQLAELLRRKLNVPPAEADQLVRLALDELQDGRPAAIQRRAHATSRAPRTHAGRPSPPSPPWAFRWP